jgi:hypothetical protein
MTGNSLNDKKVEPRQEQISALYEKHHKPKKAKKVKTLAQFPIHKGIELIAKFFSGIWQRFESITGIETRFIKFALSMEESNASEQLTVSQVGLYHILKRKYTKVNGKFNENNITFPQSEWIKYYSRKSAFDKDMDNLIELGFIRVIQYRGKYKKATIYGYSAQWKHYGTDLFSVTDKDRRPKDTLTLKQKKAISEGAKKSLAKRYSKRATMLHNNNCN